MNDFFQLVPDPTESYAYYDAYGNRHVLHSHAEYMAARRGQMIEWLNRIRTFPYMDGKLHAVPV